MINLPDVAVGAVAAAMIAGLFALLGLIISKEQKISEFRQAWIDALRSDIALTIAYAYAVEALPEYQSDKVEERWKMVHPSLSGLNETIARIKLRVNPKEGQAILATIQEIEDAFAFDGPTMSYGQFVEIDRKLVRQAQEMLKREWDRVRAGEPVYRYAKIAGATGVCVGYMWILICAWHPILAQ
jgi:hypothetical protein